MNTLKIALSVAFAGSLLTVLPTLASAQEDITTHNISSLELSQADVREAVRALFKNVNASYTIDPDVQGPVTASLKNVTFETALQNILRQVDATYRIEAGVYVIVKRKELILNPNPIGIADPPSDHGKIIRRIKIRSADPQFIAAMLGASQGNQNYDIAPEKSTIDKTKGGSGGGQSGGGGLGSGGSGSGSSGGFGNNGGSFGSGGSGFGSGNGGSGSSNGGGIRG